MKYLFLALTNLLLSSSVLFCQKNINCEILSLMLKSDAANKAFSLKSQRDTIIILDTSHHFTSCTSISPIYGRNVFVTDDTTFLSKKKPSVITIFNFIKRGLSYKVKFFYKQTGAVGYIEAKKSNGKYIIAKSAFGYY